MRVLVTGGAGFIGTHTVKKLIENGHAPVVMDTLEKVNNEVIRSKLNIPFLKSNFGNKKNLISLLTGRHEILKNTIHENKYIEAVIHFAAYSDARESSENPIIYYKNNVLESINLLEVLCDHNLNKSRKNSMPIPLIFSSTCATFGIPEKLPIDENCPQNPINPYGRTKLIIEKMLKDLAQSNNLKSVILRYFNAAGAYEDGSFGENRKEESHLIPLAIKSALGITKELKVFGLNHSTFDGSCIRDYVHVIDIAEAHVLALEKIKNELDNLNLTQQNKTLLEQNCFEYNIGLEKGFSVLEIIKKVEDIAGDCPYVVIEKKKGDPPILIASSKKIKKELGWEPKYKRIDEIIIHSFNWFKKFKY